MNITDIRIKLIEGDASRQRLRAFCSIMIDNSFVVRDLKILEGNQGYFVAMPSRKLAFRCPHCHQKNSVGSNFCNNCGSELSRDDPYRELVVAFPSKLYVDVVHPINTPARERMHVAIIEAYELEKERSMRPGYVSSYEDFYEGDD